MNTQNQFVTQLASLVALVVAWINPDAQLSSGVQTAVIAIAGAVTAIVHVVAVLERKHGGSATQTTAVNRDTANGVGTTLGVERDGVNP